MVMAILAVGIFLSDATAHEGRLLMSIFAHESSFSRDVATCRVLGDGGHAFGVAQIHPRSSEERRAACDVTRVVPLALARVRESVAACGDLTGYVSGRCGVGKRAAKERWSE